jgi:hypothetical protein
MPDLFTKLYRLFTVLCGPQTKTDIRKNDKNANPKGLIVNFSSICQKTTFMPI